MENQITKVTPQSVSVFSNFEQFKEMAEYFAESKMIPAQFQHNAPDVLIALDMSQRMNMNPFMVMQQMYVVHGRPAWSSSFLIACINACGKFTNLEFEMVNDKNLGVKCRAKATRLADGKELVGTWISMEMAKQEGWTSKPGSKWLTMPEQMLKYRAAAFWQRTFAPEVSMGLRDEDEVRDIYPQDADAVEISSQQMSKAQKSIEAKKRRQAEEKAKVNDEEPQEGDTNEAHGNFDGELIGLGKPVTEELEPEPVRKSVHELAMESHQHRMQETAEEMNLEPEK